MPWHDDDQGPIDTSEESHRRQIRSGRTAGIAWLFFLGYPLADLLRGGHSILGLSLGLLGFAAFVGLYIYGFFRTFFEQYESRQSWVIILLLGAVATALTLGINDAWIGAMIFVITAAGCSLKEQHSFRAIVAITVYSAVLAIVVGASVADIFSLVFQFVLVGMALIFLRRLIRTNAELRYAREENARLAVSEERLRFARDLHDLLGHSLSLIALKSELAGRLIEVDPGRAQAEITDIEQVTRDALREVRDAVSGYRQPDLDTELSGARAALDAAGIECTVVRRVGHLPLNVESTLGWAVREGVTNVIRHSSARNCTVEIEQQDGVVTLTVTDDGDGAPSAAQNRPGRHGSGLAGLRERLSALDGELRAGPAPAGGFRLAATIPVALDRDSSREPVPRSQTTPATQLAVELPQ
jgi:two-component system sensor histidine kinase DesK